MPLDLAWIRERLPGRPIVWRSVTASTMLDARGCAPGTLVIAEEQTAGQGRLGRSWHSEPGAGLYLSAVLTLDAQPAVTLALGLATAETIAATAGVECDLRWPNDVLIAGRKCAGVLVQGAGVLIAGIGINVNHTSFPPEIAPLATSLRIVTGRQHCRERILVELAAAIDRYCRILREDGPKPVLEQFARASSYVSGKRVYVEQSGGRVEGTTAGLDASGFLILEKDDGAREVILAGGVRSYASGS